MKGEEIIERLKELVDFRRSLRTESDRGCALAAAAFLDAILENTLRYCFVSDEKIIDKFMGQNMPLGTFSSRIDAAYLLGKIGKQAWRDLHLIRRIRNEFGHNAGRARFSDPPILSRCEQLVSRILKEPSSGRDRFIDAVMGILFSLESFPDDNMRPKIKEDESIEDEHLEVVEDMADELMAACFGADTPEGVDRDARAVFIAAQRHIRRR